MNAVQVAPPPLAGSHPEFSVVALTGVKSAKP
jgi:hypothetical protein